MPQNRLGSLALRGVRATSRSAFDDIDGQAAEAGFLVAAGHVLASLAHRFYDRVQADDMAAVALQREIGRVDRLHRAHGVALYAGDLHQPPNGIAGDRKSTRLNSSH